MPARLLVPLSQADLQTADVALFRAGKDPIEVSIAVAGRGDEYHAGMVARGPVSCFLDDRDGHKFRWGLIETRSQTGCRFVSLDGLVRQHPGRIDVYRVRRGVSFDPMIAVFEAWKHTGESYGWWALLRVALTYVLLLRFIFRPNRDDTAQHPGLPFCSADVSDWLRAGGVDPVPGLADESTAPADLAHSGVFEYICTLVPDEA